MRTPTRPPRGKSWHTLSFPWELLVEGERPLLELEPCEEGDKVLVKGKWCDGIDTGAQMTPSHLPTKTTRPLPSE